MSKISIRAQKILTWVGNHRPHPHPDPLPPAGEGIAIRQQTLAELFLCSRRSIGRALTELKEAGLLIDLNQRHTNRCKIYAIKIPAFTQATVRQTPQGEQQLKLYRSTFEINFRHWPDWEKYYPQVTWELRYVTDIHLLFRQTFDKLYAIRAQA